jgi:hypothetical protein
VFHAPIVIKRRVPPEEIDSHGKSRLRRSCSQGRKHWAPVTTGLTSGRHPQRTAAQGRDEAYAWLATPPTILADAIATLTYASQHGADYANLAEKRPVPPRDPDWPSVSANDRHSAKQDRAGTEGEGRPGIISPLSFF